MASFSESTLSDAGCVLAVDGEFDLAVVDEFVERARGCLGRADSVQLDLHDVSFIDSSGLGALVLVRNEAAQQSKSLSLVNLSAATTRLLELTGLQEAFDVRPGQS